jgi:hypothetical protein
MKDPAKLNLAQVCSIAYVCWRTCAFVKPSTKNFSLTTSIIHQRFTNTSFILHL